jgi:hypothetical protein
MPVLNKTVKRVQDAQDVVPPVLGQDGYVLSWDEGLGQYVLTVSAGSGDLTYVHNQLAASPVWNVVHNLGKFPSVTVVDSGGTVVFGEVTHVDNMQLTLTFSVAFAGQAFLN